MMKQIKGQINFDEYLQDRKRSAFHCGGCICDRCLYKHSSRCPYGKCYDDHRAKTEPYDRAHPGEAPRKAWSNWNGPGEQAHWCRGGIFHPVQYCGKFVKYQGLTVEECVDGLICVFQDGYIGCSTKNNIGCEACIDQKRTQDRIARYGCQHMTETGCEAHINALSLMAKAILEEGEDTEMCGEQCCKGCTKICGYRCGQT